MINFQYVRASTVKEAIGTLAKAGDGQFIAGGTNLVDLMKRGVTAPQKLIDINNLPLKDVKSDKTSITIGALALNSDVSENELIIKQQPLLSMALKSGASPQLRNMATVGGNMMQRTRCPYFYDTAMPCNKRKPGSGCGAIGGYNRMHAIFGTSNQCIAVHPSDMCVALTALEATVTVSGPKGSRKIPFGDFHKLPGQNPEKDNILQKGELIESVSIPENDFAKNSYYLKLRDRASYAFALVSVAAALSLDGQTIKACRLAMGGVAHKPWRLSEAEKFLAGKKASAENFEQAAKLSMAGAKSFGYNDFKLKMAPAAIVEALSKASGLS
ncbi:xanthine dehydrogenase family protein subunit M [Pedobacter sp. HMF7647]|uniref:Xanthine dehydrogenase family protein subunit M n=1 Tax=Hufsiella arboris TaxID=2695275 RepID=A0A7K1Y5R9_9SPHI|nr:xanthine dehydrogenase family protein subunit M [Hufsiella arboris]MXV49913.1 xanthine dehydrogenase family protein subunit M [Hufsiella arboris]